MEITLHPMQEIPPKSNPYLSDMSRQGLSAGNNDDWEIMWDGFDGANLVLVHKPSGKRVRIVVKQ